MTRRSRAPLLLILLGAAAALWWTRAPSSGHGAATPPPAASAPSPALASTAPPEPARAVAAAVPEVSRREEPEDVERAPVPFPDDMPPEQIALIESDPVLRERARQQALAAAADARWAEATATGQLSAEDLDPAVRRLFSGVTLEPEYAEGGRIAGLWIDAMEAEHPLAQAGFRTGDLLDSIQGVPLRDPAEIPSLLARLGPRIDVCAVRDGATTCRNLVLQ